MIILEIIDKLQLNIEMFKVKAHADNEFNNKVI
jgi:hypothetical protein